MADKRIQYAFTLSQDDELNKAIVEEHLLAQENEQRSTTKAMFLRQLVEEGIAAKRMEREEAW